MDLLETYVNLMKKYAIKANVRIILELNTEFIREQGTIRDISSLEAIDTMSPSILDASQVEFDKSLELINGLSVSLPVENFGYFSSRLSSEDVQGYSMDAPLAPHLAKHRPLVKADLAEDLGYRGEGIKIAILDTGLDTKHPDLNVIYYVNYSRASTDEDVDGHGTHVAGIAAGRGKTGKWGLGVAPKAKVIGIKVLPGYDSNIIRGMQKALEKGARIINMSLGGPGTPWDPLGKAIYNVYKKGVISIVAAGNSGPNYGTIESPACNPYAIAVAAVNYDLKITDYSSKGPSVDGEVKPDISAPGGDGRLMIISLRSKNMRNRTAFFYGDYYAKDCGTSMATPFVTGAAALVLEALKENGFSYDGEKLSDTIRYLLLSTTSKISANIWETGAGFLNVYNAVTKARKIDSPKKYKHPRPRPPIKPPKKCYRRGIASTDFLGALSTILKRYKLPSVPEEAENVILAVKKGAGLEALTLFSTLTSPYAIYRDLLVIKEIESKLSRSKSIIKSVKNAISHLAYLSKNSLISEGAEFEGTMWEV